MNASSHLTEKQLSELVIASPQEPESAASDEVYAHLHSCYTCMAELESLTGTLGQFRAVAHAVARREFASGPRLVAAELPARRQTFRWMQPLTYALAAALLVAVALPFTMPHHPEAAPRQAHPHQAMTTAKASAAVSDEALLEGVDEDLSASIPDSMQPLADPTATAANTTSTQRTN